MAKEAEHEKIDFTITMRRQTEPPLLGFHQEWIGAEDHDAYMSCGAGLGNPHLQVKVGDTYYIYDIRELFTAILERETCDKCRNPIHAGACP